MSGDGWAGPGGSRPGWEKECERSPFCMIREREAENIKNIAVVHGALLINLGP